ncbi:FAD:protein FMN transferase [Aquifex pyrophilus]
MIFLLLLLSFLFAERVFYLMGTYLITDNIEGKEVKVYRYLRGLEEKISHFIPESDVSQINRNADIKSVKVSRETYELVKISLEMARKTYGYFDPTVGSYTINKKKELINYRNVVLRDGKVFLKKRGMALDFGGIGKGYALDKAKEFLKTEKGFLALSGDMAIWGHTREIGIYNPLTKGILLKAKNKGDVCISTSGNYFRKHIIGKEGNKLQVTVLHERCAVADALATALFASPEGEIKKILRNFPKAGVLILYKDGSLYINKAFREYLKDITIF